MAALRPDADPLGRYGHREMGHVLPWSGKVDCDLWPATAIPELTADHCQRQQHADRDGSQTKLQEREPLCLRAIGEGSAPTFATSLPKGHSPSHLTVSPPRRPLIA